MEVWLCAAAVFLAAVAVASGIKIYLLQKAAEEIREAFADRLMTETNTLICISSRDPHMRKLAEEMNGQLRRLRDQRRRYVLGDVELKNAVTNISHDLRTPLTAICGYLDLLEENLSPQNWSQEGMPEQNRPEENLPEQKLSEARRYIQIMKNRTEMLNQLTEELFRYSVILAAEDDLKKEPVNIGEVLEESMAAFYAVLCGSSIAPVIRMPREKIVRSLDRAALSRVFSNLLHNVVKYSDGDLEIELFETGLIVFSNAASGLNEIQVGRLFERFYTVESARKSTGLGLAIAQTLVQRMGGTIEARYRDGRLYIDIFFPR